MTLLETATIIFDGDVKTRKAFDNKDGDRMEKEACKQKK